MTEIVALDPELAKAIASDRSAPLPTANPSWIDSLTAAEENARGLVAIHRGAVTGWLFYTVARREGLTVFSSLPYVAYAGIHAHSSSDLGALVSRYRQVAQNSDADVVSLGTSPLASEEDERIIREAFAPTHTLENFAQLSPLAPHPLSLLRKKRRDAFRSELRKASTAGLRVIRSIDANQLEHWLKIYRSRYDVIGATPYPDRFHRAVYEIAVPAGAAEFWAVLDAQSRLRGGVLFLTSSTEVTYFSSAFDEEARTLDATTLLLNQAFEGFSGRGIPMFNWQSSPGRGGVYQYKLRWGAREHRHFYLSALLRPASGLFERTPEDIRALFPMRFVLPFSAWSTIQNNGS